MNSIQGCLFVSSVTVATIIITDSSESSYGKWITGVEIRQALRPVALRIWQGPTKWKTKVRLHKRVSPGLSGI